MEQGDLSQEHQPLSTLTAISKPQKFGMTSVHVIYYDGKNIVILWITQEREACRK